LSFALWNDDHPYSPATRNDINDIHTDTDDVLQLSKPYPGGGGHTKGVLAVDHSG
jgi:hypothetical protein